MTESFGYITETFGHYTTVHPYWLRKYSTTYGCECFHAM